MVNATFSYLLGEDREHHFRLRLVNVFNEKCAERYGVGNQRFGSAFNRGDFATARPQRYCGCTFEGGGRGASTPPIR